MKAILFAAAVAVLAPVLGVTGASAADISSRPYTKAPPVAPVASWTGFYAGVNIGYGFNDPTVSFIGGDPLIQGFTVGGCGLCGGPVPSASYNIQGVTGGGQIGYNWQVAPAWLVGIEADFNGFGVSNTVTSAFAFADRPIGNSIVATQSNEWFGTVRARLGWLQSSNLLVYGTGGFAYGQMNESVVMNQNGSGSGVGYGYAYICTGTGANCFVGSQSRIAMGYTAGAGVEYAVTRNVTIKAEYLYVNLGSTSLRASATVPAPFIPASFIASFSDYHFNVVRFGANYRF